MTSVELAIYYSQLPPVDPAKHSWLQGLRPSQAFLLCLCSGPWKLPRRKRVQQAAINTLGTRDLAELSSIDFNFPLGWQRKYYDIAIQDTLVNFDTDFAPGISAMEFRGVFGNDWDKIPKTIALFARDYLGLNCFPVDRHVKAWCETHGIRAKPSTVMALCSDAGIRPGDLSRAIFASKSENPTDIVFPS